MKAGDGQRRCDDGIGGGGKRGHEPRTVSGLQSWETQGNRYSSKTSKRNEALATP